MNNQSSNKLTNESIVPSNVPQTNAITNASNKKLSKFGRSITRLPTKLIPNNQTKIDNAIKSYQNYDTKINNFDVTIQNIDTKADKLLNDLTNISTSIPIVKSINDNNSSKYISNQYKSALDLKETYGTISSSITEVTTNLNNLSIEISQKIESMSPNISQKNSDNAYQLFKETKFQKQKDSLDSLVKKIADSIENINNIEKNLNNSFSPLMTGIKAEIIDSVIDYYGTKLNLNKKSFNNLYDTIKDAKNDTSRLAILTNLKGIVDKIEKYITDNKKLLNKKYFSSSNNTYSLENTNLSSLEGDYQKLTEKFNELNTKLNEAISNYKSLTEKDISDLKKQIEGLIGELQKTVSNSQLLLGNNFKTNTSSLSAAISTLNSGYKNIGKGLNATLISKLKEIGYKIDNALNVNAGKEEASTTLNKNVARPTVNNNNEFVKGNDVYWTGTEGNNVGKSLSGVYNGTNTTNKNGIIKKKINEVKNMSNTSVTLNPSTRFVKTNKLSKKF